MDKYTYALLETFEKRASLSLVELGAIFNVGALDMVEPVKYYMHLGYIGVTGSYNDDGCNSQEIKMNTPLKITMKGRSVLDEEIKARKSEKRMILHDWINSVVAVAALILAILNLILS